MAPFSSHFRAVPRSKALSLTAKSLFLVLLLTLSSGCGVFHYIFYPPEECVCSSEMLLAQPPSDEHEDPSLLEDGDDEAHAYSEHEEGDEEGDEDEVAANIQPGDLQSLGIEETNEGVAAPRQRTLTREPASTSPEQTARLAQAHKVVDVVEASARVDISSDAERRAAEQKYGVSLPSNAHVMAGDFLRDQESLAVVIPGNSIKIYSNGRLAAQRSLANTAPSADFSDLNAEIALPVRLVQNNSLQLLVHLAEPQPDGAILYKARIYKVIGSDLGIIFDQTLARRQASDQPLQRLGNYEFLQGMNHRFIRLTTFDADGNPLEEPQVLRWNRWEGVYRLPVPPPTAPKNQNQS